MMATERVIKTLTVKPKGKQTGLLTGCETG
jgi:hypothetical protein